MTRLILTSSDSGDGNLLTTRIADVVVPLEFRLVWGAPPTEVELYAKLGPGSLDHFPQRRLREFHSQDMGTLDLCEHCDAIDLWFDPSPNAQLMLVQLLDCLKSRTSVVPKLTLFQADVEIGNQSPETLSNWKPPDVKIRSDHLEVASMAWQAYRQPTPQDWFDLLDKDIGALPQLRQTVLEMLEELPMPASGLGATEIRLLELISAGDLSPFDVFPGHMKRNTRRVFGYWEIGALLDGLARGPVPAVSGLDEGPFAEELHRDKARFERYKQSKLSLTALGKAILARTEDFSRHSPIHRWWGGTRLTSENLWRWDPVSHALIAP
jgi:hypothetical protein